MIQSDSKRPLQLPQMVEYRFLFQHFLPLDDEKGPANNAGQVHCCKIDNLIAAHYKHKNYVAGSF